MTRTFKTFILLCLLLLGAISGVGAATATSSYIDSTHILAAGIEMTAQTSNYRFVATGTEIRFTATGTALTATCYSQTTTPFVVTIDGGTASTPANPAVNSFVQFPIFSGLSDTAHTVVLKYNSVVAITLDVTGAQAGFTLTGATPVFSLPTGYNKNYQLKTAGSFVQIDAIYTQGNLNDPGATPGIYTTALNSTFAFKATCTSIMIYGILEGTTYTVTQDGTEVANTALATVTGNASNSWGWTTLATGLSGGAEHLYRIIIVGPYASGIDFTSNLSTGGGTGINESATYPARKSYWVNGDSITRVWGITPIDNGSNGLTKIGFPYKLGLRRGVACTSFGTAGAVVPNSISAFPGKKPDYIIFLWGTNDISHATTISAFTTSYTAMINSALSAAPSAQIICLGILPRSDNAGYNTSRPSYNTAIQSSVAACTTPARVTYKSTDAYWTPVIGVNSNDGLHPNDTGYNQIEAKLAVDLGLLSAALFRSRSGFRAGSRSSQ